MKRRIVQVLLCAAVSCCVICNSSIKTAAKESACYLPSEYIEWCVDAEKAQGVSAPLIAAIIQCESSAEAEATNGNCWGLMQVSTSHVYYDSDLLDPEQNIRFGTSVLAECFEKANGDVVLALMYYEGVSDAKAKYEAWVEAGDYSQYPNGYVTKVLETQEAITEEWYGVPGGADIDY